MNNKKGSSDIVTSVLRPYFVMSLYLSTIIESSVRSSSVALSRRRQGLFVNSCHLRVRVPRLSRADAFGSRSEILRISRYYTSHYRYLLIKVFVLSNRVSLFRGARVNDVACRGRRRSFAESVPRT